MGHARIQRAGVQIARMRRLIRAFASRLNIQRMLSYRLNIIWMRMHHLDAYAQADLKLCWSHIPHCCKFHVMAHICYYTHSKICIENEDLNMIKKKQRQGTYCQPSQE